MNVIITGRGTSGSWQIRGLQLGRAIGASVIPEALDVGGYDVAVLVKRARGNLIERLHRAGVPVVWDVVDAWPQPEGNSWGRAECLAWLADQIRRIQPRAIIAATQRMARDVAEVADIPATCIPHHGRPGSTRTEIRQDLRVVAYEGSIKHLGTWGEKLVHACAARKLSAIFNPPTLNDADVVVALREADGYAARHWKSNVKLANAQATGTPVICVPESGYLETCRGATIFVEDEHGLGHALDGLVSHETRQHLADSLYADRITLAFAARQYREFLGTVCSTASSS